MVLNNEAQLAFKGWPLMPIIGKERETKNIQVTFS